jgi:lysophospholipase L1-like esterase
MEHSEIRCVFFGDSITAGQYVDPSFHWTTLLGERMATAGFPDVSYASGAVPGETTRQGLERFPAQVQAIRPQVVTIQFGLNDCNQWQTDEGHPRVSTEAFEANLVEMGMRARRFGASQVMLLTTHPTLKPTVFMDGSTYEENRRRYNDIVRQVATRLTVRLVDIEEAFDGMRHRLAELLLDPPDVLHLSPAGHVVYADVVEPVLLEALRMAAGDPGGGVPAIDPADSRSVSDAVRP